MQLGKMKTAALGLCVTAMLAACGGGGSEIPLNSFRAAGMWHGTSDTNREVSAVTLADGRYFAVYSGAGGNATIGGGVQGTSAVVDGQLVSSDLLSFSVELQPPVTGTFTASVDPFTSITGTATVANQPPATFQANFEEDFRNQPSLAAVAGSYTGEAGFQSGVRPATFNISATGEVTSTINGCSITGTVKPRADGNAYDLSVLFGGDPCALPNLTFNGIVFLREGGNHLYSVSRNTAARQTIVFTGLKQG